MSPSIEFPVSSKMFPSGARVSSSGQKKLALGKDDGLAAEQDSIAGDFDVDHASSRRCLISNESRLLEPLAPEVRQAAMSRTRHRVFVDPGGGSEEPGNEIGAR